jgi:hypothetical protein
MKTNYDKAHRDLELEVGEWAWLWFHQRSAVAITDKTNAKLVPSYYDRSRSWNVWGTLHIGSVFRRKPGFMTCFMSSFSSGIMVIHQRALSPCHMWSMAYVYAV